MYNKITAADIAAIKKIVGDEFVLVGDEINHDYSHDELGGIEREFVPAMDEAARAKLLGRWRKAVERSKAWAEE